mmetsp:Transcript_28601/g.42821  ORF Transcript_28601/g.42821 Transcript_28601/m.42821 type:complete len:712 (+) Transcript_28601:100-2235(+)
MVEVNGQRAILSAATKTLKRKNKKSPTMVVSAEEVVMSQDAESEWYKDKKNIAAIVVTFILASFGAVYLQQKQNEDAKKEKHYGDDDIIIEDETQLSSGFFDKVEIGFENIQMTLAQKSKNKPKRVILDGSIRGTAKPGRMLAIMGPSGSGKTTLVHAIAGKVKENPRISLSGQRYVNGAPISGDSQIPSAFIEQEVSFFPHMTVRETLDFRVELKLGRKLGKSARDDVVEELMDKLSLTKSADTKVGNAKIRGLSGGERKRLSIACEMISSPPVIFLDEPTSGLDSYQATQVIETLRKLANEDGKTIIAVIHQPSQHVFSMFDDLLLLSEGKLMYFGEVNNVRGYLKDRDFGCEEEMGTAEHVLETISPVTGSSEAEKESMERLEKLSDYATAHVKDIVIRDPKHAQKKSGNEEHTKHLVMAHSTRGAGIIRQFKLLIKRAFNEQLRGKAAIIIKTVQQVSLGVIYGGIYHLGNNQASIMDRFGLISLIAIGAANMAMAGTIRSFPKEKAIVSNELSSHMYRTLPYFCAKAISEIPLIGMFTTMFGCIIYPLTGLRKGGFKKFLLLNTLHTVASEGVGLLLGAISPSTDVALSLFPMIIVLNVIFDGRNISEENTPRGLRWILKVGLIRWGFEGMALNEFEGLEFDTKGPRRGPVAKNGMEALARFGLDGRTVEQVIKAQSLLIGGSWFLSYLGLSLTRQRFEVMESPKN